MKMKTHALTFLIAMAVSSSAVAATKDAEYKALFGKAQQAYSAASGHTALAKARIEQLPAQRKKLLAVKAAVEKADAIVKDDLTRIATLRKYLKELPGLVKKGEALVNKDIADVKISSGVQIRKALFRMTLDFRGNQGRKGNLWLDANIFGVEKKIKTAWDFNDVKPGMEKLGRLLATIALAEANYKAKQLGIDVNEVKAAATGTASVLKTAWKTTKDFVDHDAVTALKGLKLKVEHAAKN